MPRVLVVAAMTAVTTMANCRRSPGVSDVVHSAMVMPGVTVSIIVMRVNLWMLGVPGFRWSGSSMSSGVLMVSHVALSSACKCLRAYRV